MKKKILLLTFLLIPTITLAKITDENINELKLETYNAETASMNKTYIEEDDYIIFLAEQGIYRYDKKTYEFKKVSFGNWDTTIVPFYGNYLTISRIYDSELGYNYNKLSVLDSDLNVLEQKDIDLPGDYYYYGELYKDGDTIYLSVQNSSDYYIVDKDLNVTLATTTPSESEASKLTQEFTTLISTEDSTLKLYDVEKNKDNSYYVVVGYEDKENNKLKVELREYDNNKNLLIKKVLYEDAYTFNQYWAVDVSYKKETLEDYYLEAYSIDDVSKINIYDKNNNLIKSINPSISNNNSSTSYGIGDLIAILPTYNGFYIIGSSWTTNYPLTSTMGEVTARGIVGITIFMKYSFDYKVDTKSNGNGKITSEKGNASNSEKVTFTIIPDDGYVLSKVTVTDNEGNKIEFTENTFTMPSANVIIEATFVPVNPDTSDIIIIASITIIIGSFISYLNIKKMKELL